MEPRAGLILANRAYYDHELPPGEEQGVAAGRGGLLAALRPAIASWDGHSGTTWIGAGRGTCDRAYTDEYGVEFIQTPCGPLRHRRLYFDDPMWRGHYAESANGFLWPLLHLVRVALPHVVSYYPRPRTPGSAAWASYEAVNRAFAEAAIAEAASESCWVHDYQLALAPAFLREAGVRMPIGFFLHTPFPDLDIAGQYLDSAARQCFRAFLSGILSADLIGLQSDADVVRMMRAVAAFGLGTVGDGVVHVGDRVVRIRAHPVGIDVDEVANAARTARIPDIVAGSRDPSLPLVVGLERADFTKGIPERLAAVAALFERGLRFHYAGVAAPTREGVPGYTALKAAVAAGVRHCEAAAASGSGQFTYLERTDSWANVVALQREADVVFTSSLADGMNLVPLQAVIAQAERPAEERGVIITGRDTGVGQVYAGYEDDGLVAVDPLNPVAMTTALAHALSGRPARISDRLVAAVRSNDALTWAGGFLEDLTGTPVC